MFLIHSLLLGAILTFIYDGFLIIRKVIRHSTFFVSLEDMIFWIACALLVFYTLYKENNGILRWFAVAGAALGMVVYKKTLSSFVIEAASRAFTFIYHILSRILGIVMKPLHFLGKKVQKGSHITLRKGRKLGKYLKKKLTAYQKVLKIILCKH